MFFTDRLFGLEKMSIAKALEIARILLYFFLDVYWYRTLSQELSLHRENRGKCVTETKSLKEGLEEKTLRLCYEMSLWVPHFIIATDYNFVTKDIIELTSRATRDHNPADL
jgi:hypothetical protein